MIKPHFKFGSTIMYSCYTNQQIERLQRLQNKAIRLILRCNKFTSTEYMLESLKCLNVKRLKLNTLNFIKKK